MSKYTIYLDGTSDESLKFQKFLKKNGSNFTYTKELIEAESFEDYLAMIVTKVVDEDTKDYYSELLEMKYADYLEFKQSCIDMIDEYIKSLNDNKEEVDYKIPYHKILNGNFVKLSHAHVTEQEKIFYNIDGLPDEMWDVYLDTDENGVLTGRFQTVYYDIITKNKQFWDFYLYLKKYSELSSIKFNTKAHLMCFDRDLLGVDTFMKLTPEMQTKVAQEGRRNPWFHMRECARIVKNQEVTRFEMTIQQYVFIWLYCQNFNTFLSAPRQIGKTYIVTHLLAYEFAYGSSDFDCGFLHYEYNRAVDNKKDVIDIADNFPDFLRWHQVRNRVKKGVQYKNVEASIKTGSKETRNEQLNNTLVAIAVSPQEKQAEKAGRGRRLRFMLFDEFNFVKNIMAAMSGVQFATTTTHDFARKKGIRHSIHYASTAGDLTTLAGRQMYDVVTNKICKFDNKLLAMSYDELRNYMLATSEMNFFFVEYGYAELGMSEAWYDERRRSIPDGKKFRNEILMEWVSSSTDSLFSQEHIERIETWIDATHWDTYLLDNRYMIDYVKTKNSNNLIDELRNFNVIALGIDIAHGGGGEADSTVIYAMDMETCMPIFEYATNTLLILDFIYVYKKFCDLIWEGNPTAKIISAIEWDGPGQDVIPIIMQDPKYGKTVFARDVYYAPEIADKGISGSTKKFSYDTKTLPGSRVKGRRDYMTQSLLTQLVERQPYVFNHPKAVDEIKTLRAKKVLKGVRIEAKPGSHDDRTFARLHANGLVFDDTYREAVYKKFNYVVDFHKIKFYDMNEHKLGIDDIVNNDYLDKEGELNFREYIRYTDNMEPVDDIYCTKVINGNIVRLTLTEIIEEAKNNQALADLVFKVTSKMKSNVNMRSNPFKNRNDDSLTGSEDGYVMKSIRDMSFYGREKKEDEGLLY